MALTYMSESHASRVMMRSTCALTGKGNWSSPRSNARYIHPAPENLRAVGDVEKIEMLSSKAEAAYGTARRRQWQDGADAAVLVTYLNSHPGRYIQISVRVYRDILSAAIIGNVGHVQPIKSLFGFERAIRLNDIAVNPFRAVLGGVEKRTVWRKADSGGGPKSLIDNSLFAAWLELPDPARHVVVRARFADVESTCMCHDDSAAHNAFGDSAAGALRIQLDDSSLSGNNAEECTVWTKSLTGNRDPLAEDGRLAAGADTIDGHRGRVA